MLSFLKYDFFSVLHRATADATLAPHQEAQPIKTIRSNGTSLRVVHVVLVSRSDKFHSFFYLDFWKHLTEFAFQADFQAIYCLKPFCG